MNANARPPKPLPRVDAAPPSMTSAGKAELHVLRSRFCMLVADWRLTQGELRPLLGVVDAWSADRILPDAIDARAETSMRLMLRLDRGLVGILRGEVDVADWLRGPEPDLAGRTPVEAFADLATLRAVVCAIERSGH